MKNGDEPIHPTEVDLYSKDGDVKIASTLDGNPFSIGLTKREYFAAMALQGILSNPSHNVMDLMGVNTAGPLGFIAADFAAKEALGYADQLLKQLLTSNDR